MKTRAIALATGAVLMISAGPASAAGWHMDPSGQPQAAGWHMDPNGQPQAAGWHMDPNGYGTMVDPNGYGAVIDPNGARADLGPAIDPLGFWDWMKFLFRL